MEDLSGNIKMKIQSNPYGNIRDIYVKNLSALLYNKYQKMKMLSDKVNLAGLFTIVLYTNVKTTMQGSTYSFVTNQHIDDRGIYIMAKSPRGMFPDKLIPNDMGYVLQKIEKYNNAE